MYTKNKNQRSTSDNQARFAKVPGATIERSSFDRSHGRKSTFNSGQLVPIFVDEALPGDTYNVKMATYARLATPLRPVLDNLYLDSFFFAVPNRLLWENWVRMMGQQDSPGDSTDFLVPQVTGPALGYEFGSLYDHLGIPPGVNNLNISALALRACNKIWNEWFRDENLQDALVENFDDGPDDADDYPLQRRGKRHDYFTSCLPFPQKGPAVELPIGSVAPVVGTLGGSVAPLLQGDDIIARSFLMEPNSTPDSNTHFSGAQYTGAPTAMFWETTGLEADLSSATASTINAIREAFQLQKLFERDARGGTRYVESIKAHFGVVSPDFRQQRSEYLGGGSQQISFTPVAQTANLNGTMGVLGAFATSASNSHGFVKSFTEHCTIIGFVSLRADLNYQDGLQRMWSRRTRFDFAYPVFTGLGEQAVLNKEIFAQGTAADDEVFGYQERYAEYRYKPSEICGQFRSKFAQPLDVWHLAQDFDNLPTLSASFIVENPPVDRILAIPNETQVLFDAHFKCIVARPLPVYGVPGNMDRL